MSSGVLDTSVASGNLIAGVVCGAAGGFHWTWNLGASMASEDLGAGAASGRAGRLPK